MAAMVQRELMHTEVDASRLLLISTKFVYGII